MYGLLYTCTRYSSQYGTVQYCTVKYGRRVGYSTGYSGYKYSYNIHVRGFIIEYTDLVPYFADRSFDDPSIIAPRKFRGSTAAHWGRTRQGKRVRWRVSAKLSE